ncbi:MAG: LL-diaminopimelate aminotransferase, partial [Candidatus Latescibacteria bacterium]|nr:LL-diaminopimelate aminotransferase [Candidatus Latescibacterota bacterium]
VEPTPAHIIDQLCKAAYDKANHRYPSYSGMIDFKQAIARWYRNRAGVELDPKIQVLTLIGAKEGIAHIPFAFVNPGDTVLVPSPAYPVYRNSTILAGGDPVVMPLLQKNGFLPDLGAIDSDTARKAKMMFLNYPNNPTGAVASLDFFQQVVEFAQDYNIVICHDAAYLELGFDGYRAPSFLQAEGALEIGVEFYSLSKTYNMTGWRIGAAAGNADVIAALGTVKTNIDSGAFQAVQWAGIQALKGPQQCVEEQKIIYQQRRDLLLGGLRSMRLQVDPPQATCYLWCPVPQRFTSTKFAAELIERIGVVVTPGVGFGKYGEGFIRLSLTVETDRLKEAVRRMKTIRF